ncbi:hypothetical protein [Allofournierella sp.]|uniref:hypothetical protein n=1 Tax=Allofournierella sp. TaxID=1940256 RepID=UPI003AF0FB4D
MRRFKIDPQKLADLRSFYEQDIKPMDETSLQLIDTLLVGFYAHKQLIDNNDGSHGQKAS